MPESRYDCIVIGSGPGGYVAAIRAAQLGMKTAVVEKEFIGGRCLNIACIPAKAVLRAADVLSEVRHAGDFGIKVGEPEVDFAGVGAHRDKVIKTLTGDFVSVAAPHTGFFNWKAPASIKGSIQHCVRVQDAAGNVSPVSCARVTLSG